MLKQQVTQEELRQQLAKVASVSEEVVAKILEELALIAAREARINGGFLLPGIGMIENVERFERTGINPATGEKMLIPPSVKLHFQFESRFKKAVSTRQER